MSIFVLNMPFAIEKPISTFSSKINRRLVWQEMWIKQDLPTYNASINLRTKCSEREKRCGTSKIKSAISKLFHNLHCEFYPHRHWRRELRCFIVCTTSRNFNVIAYSFCWRERKRKYSKTLIAMDRDHYVTFASYSTPTVSHFQLPLNNQLVVKLFRNRPRCRSGSEFRTGWTGIRFRSVSISTKYQTSIKIKTILFPKKFQYAVQRTENYDTLMWKIKQCKLAFLKL